MDAPLPDLLEWIVTRTAKRRKPALVTLPKEMPEHVRKFMESNASMQNARAAWDAYDAAMVLSDNDARLADQAFAAVRATRKRKKS